MPSLRAELYAAQRERGTQLALALYDNSRVSSRPVPPRQRVADQAEPGGSGQRAVPLAGLAAPKSLAA
jgi:hypothetical protein